MVEMYIISKIKVLVCNSYTLFFSMTYFSLVWLPKNQNRMDDEIEYFLWKFLDESLLDFKLLQNFANLSFYITYVIQNQINWSSFSIYHISWDIWINLASWFFLMCWLIHIIERSVYILRNIKYNETMISL